jgi:hypothetical protein
MGDQEWLYVIAFINWAFMLFLLSDICAELRTLNANLTNQGEGS